MTGRPVPAAVGRADRQGARERFSVAADDRCLLVFGGSQGARSINLCALDAFTDDGPAARDRGYHVLHIAGSRDYQLARERIDRAPGAERYTLLEYEPNLADALAASDLVLARAGGSVFEVAAAGRAAILVPYPYATAQHQHANAAWMADAGAALVIEDEALDAAALARTVGELFTDTRRLRDMSAASLSLARPDAAERIAAAIVRLPGDDRLAGPKAPLHRDRRRGHERARPRLPAARRHRLRLGPLRRAYMEHLRAAGLEPGVGHDSSAVPPDADVVVSTAVGPDNPELAIARDRGQRIMHRGELLAELSSMKRLIAVAGTHGKTTTAGMLAHALVAIGADPAFLLGGELPGAGEGGAAANAAWGAGEWIVAEADESDASFLRLRPEIAVVTNVELDHHSHWSSRAELIDAFGRFCAPASGLALPADGSLDALAEGQRVVGFDADAPGPPLELRVPGRHNRLNARAALAAVELAGLDVDGASAALSSFPGMLRRLELKGRRDGATVYDDYAHHPTEVAATLAALRELGPRRLIAVFQPHLYSRTKALGPGFGRALAAADEVAVLDVYPAREEPVGPLAGVSGLDVARAAADHAGGRPVWWLVDAERAERALAPRLREGDVLVTIGAGDIYRLADRLVGSE